MQADVQQLTSEGWDATIPPDGFVLVSYRSGLAQAVQNVTKKHRNISPRDLIVYSDGERWIVVRHTRFFTWHGDAIKRERERTEPFLCNSFDELIRCVIPDRCFNDGYDLPPLVGEVLLDIVRSLSRNGGLKRAIETLDTGNWTDEEQILYDVLTAKRERKVNGNRLIPVT